MNRVFCIGELLIDFVCKDIGVKLEDGVTFEKKAGGAPANVAAAITMLGGQAYFLGKVGEDFLGHFLIKTLYGVNINTEMTVIGGNTTMAFVSIDSNGERDFKFKRGADGEYSFDSIDLNRINSKDIIHFGSATALMGGELKDTYLKLLKYSKENNIFISFDPNYREALIENIEQFRKDSIIFIKEADIIKLSEEETKIIGSSMNLDKAILNVMEVLGQGVLFITLGKAGTMVITQKERFIVPSIDVRQVDSTGAGDAFVGALLYKLTIEDNKVQVLNNMVKLRDIVFFCNVVGAITCTKYGAIASLPSIEEVESVM